MRALLLILFFVLSASSSAEQRRHVQTTSTTPAPLEALHVEKECRPAAMENYFSWADYGLLGGMLVISCMIGTFYGFFSKKQETSNDFLLGGSDMGTIPMAMSLAASFVTAIELLGNPAEMYQHVSSIYSFLPNYHLFKFIFENFNVTQRR